MLLDFTPLLRIMNPGVCTMSLFADYVKFCAKVKGQVTLTFDTHVSQASHHFSKLRRAQRHQYYIPRFKAISPLVPEKKKHGSHICHVLIFINFHFLVPKSFPMKFGYKWPSGFWEKQVLIMTLTLNTHVVSFTYLATCIYKFSDHRLK